jgi:ATP-dependent Clp protease ATP-binding subunit ClpA
MKRAIQQQIQNPLATEILKGNFSEGSTIKVDFQNDEFVFERVDEQQPAEPAGSGAAS